MTLSTAVLVPSASWSCDTKYDDAEDLGGVDTQLTTYLNGRRIRIIRSCGGEETIGSNCRPIRECHLRGKDNNARRLTIPQGDNQAHTMGIILISTAWHGK